MDNHVLRLKVNMSGEPVGDLAYVADPADGRTKIFFQYAQSFIDTGFNLSPFNLRFDRSLQLANNNFLSGLHGVFNGSLPDGWGLLLMDRALKERYGWDVNEITPLDRLAYIGDRSMGSLEYVPELLGKQESIPVDLAQLSESAMLLVEGKSEDVIQALLLHGGSPGGARPKITAAFSADMEKCISGFSQIPQGYVHHIVKFNAKDDLNSTGLIEQAYAKIARSAGIDMPASTIIELPEQNKSYFAVQRFDRQHNDKRHIVSLGGMMEANYREPCMDYDGLLSVVATLTKNQQDVVNAFRLMVFNVLAHNKDDHVKNFAFLYDNAQWKLAPAFDLTFSSGMGNEHTTAINGSGNPSIKDFETIARNHGINDWESIVFKVQTELANFPVVAASLGVSAVDYRPIEKAINAISSRINQRQTRKLKP